MRVNSPTAQVWPYPLSRPSWRFNYFNDYVRSLDVRYAALPSRKRDNWEWFYRNFPWSVLCLEEFIEPPPEFYRFATGVEAYRNYNCNQLIQGLPVADDPVTVATRPDNDTISPVGSTPMAVSWGGRSVTPVGTFVASVRECSLNHAPESGPRPSKMKWSFSAPIVYGDAFSLVPCLTNRPGSDRLPAMAVFLSISDSAGVTFAAGRQVYLRPYV